MRRTFVRRRLGNVAQREGDEQAVQRLPRPGLLQQVEEGVWRCTKEFYSFKSMAKRLLLPPGKFTWQGLTENMLFWYGAKRQIDPVDYY